MPFPASTSFREHVSGVALGSVQVHPAPPHDVGVNPAGGMSVTVTVPIVGPISTFATVIMNESPTSPGRKIDECVLKIVRSAGCTRTVAVAVLPVPPFVDVPATLLLF